MGRTKVDNPANKRFTVRFKDEEYDLLLEYAENHKMTIAQVIRMAVAKQILTEQK